MELYIEKNDRKIASELDFELVERKGVGHPDTICDAIAETASKNYLQYCLKNFGRPAHYWFDKVMLIGGEANIDFQKGVVEKPYRVIFAGKVSKYIADKEIPLEQILFASCVEVLEKVLTGFDKNKHLVIDNQLVDYQGAGRKSSRYRPSTIEDLPEITSEQVSNDTNLLSGYAPLSPLENLVLTIERYINGKVFKEKFYDTGWDVKVFGSRSYNNFKLVVNIPFLAKYIKSTQHYFERKNEVYKHLKEYLNTNFSYEVDLEMNATDRNGRAYLTALGSVADTGDVGVVGRGNRINGLITPMRPMSIEASSGKNSVDHTGKLYAILADDLAKDIYDSIEIPVEVHIFTTKERQLDSPDEIIIKLSNQMVTEEERNIIQKIVQMKLANITDIVMKLINDGVTLW